MPLNEMVMDAYSVAHGGQIYFNPDIDIHDHLDPEYYID